MNVWQLLAILAVLAIAGEIVRSFTPSKRRSSRRSSRRQSGRLEEAFLPPMPPDAPVTREGREPEVWPLEAKPLLSPVERELYEVLRAAMPGARIMCQVAMSSLVRVRGGDSTYWHNRYSQWSVDFVVCDHHLNVIAAVELDDSSHLRGSVQERDARKDKALASAGIRLLRWRTNAMPNVAGVRKAFGARHI